MSCQVNNGKVIYEKLKEELSKADLWNKPCKDFCSECINCQFWSIVRKVCCINEKLRVYEDDSNNFHEIFESDLRPDYVDKLQNIKKTKGAKYKSIVSLRKQIEKECVKKSRSEN